MANFSRRPPHSPPLPPSPTLAATLDRVLNNIPYKDELRSRWHREGVMLALNVEEVNSGPLNILRDYHNAHRDGPCEATMFIEKI